MRRFSFQTRYLFRKSGVILLAVVLGVSMLSCRGEVEGTPNFFPGVEPPPPPPPPPLVGALDGMKISPGSVQAAGTFVGAQAAVTNDHHHAAGAVVSGKFAIGKYQVR